jgi:hypothetical protein
MTERQKSIVACWMRHEEDDPNISTEQLMHRVETDCKCDAGEVAEALHQNQTEES